MNRTAFYTAIRPLFGGAISQKQVDGLEAVLAATEKQPLTFRAYLLATTFHETDKTMQPLAEYGKGRGRPYGKPGKHGQAQYGRGYVQLTWDANYEKADKALGLNGALLRDFNMAMQPTIAAQILVRGCVEGWFGHKLSDHLPGDYVGARRCVNGTDKAELIAGYARKFEAALLLLSRVNETPKIEHDARPHVNETPKSEHDENPSIWAALFEIFATIFRKGA